VHDRLHNDLQDLFTYSICNNLNVTSAIEARVRLVKRPRTGPDAYLPVLPNSSKVIDVLKNDAPGLRITSVRQPAAGLGTVAIVNCSGLQNLRIPRMSHLRTAETACCTPLATSTVKHRCDPGFGGWESHVLGRSMVAAAVAGARSCR
jgi:hypothetical protein